MQRCPDAEVAAAGGATAAADGVVPPMVKSGKPNNVRTATVDVIMLLMVSRNGRRTICEINFPESRFSKICRINSSQTWAQT